MPAPFKVLRDEKVRFGQAIGGDELRRLVDMIAAPLAVLREKGSDTILVVFNPLDADRKVKVVVRLNFTTKVKTPTGRERVVTNSIRTAGRIDASHLRNTALYEVLEDEL